MFVANIEWLLLGGYDEETIIRLLICVVMFTLLEKFVFVGMCECPFFFVKVLYWESSSYGCVVCWSFCLQIKEISQLKSPLSLYAWSG
jgi:hypothetical protein